MLAVMNNLIFLLHLSFSLLHVYAKVGNSEI